MIRFSSSASARYLVFEQTVCADGTANLFKVFCDTIVEARQVLVRNWERWQRSEGGIARLTTSNGHTPRNLPAAAVRYQSQRRAGRYTVAKATFPGGSAELGIIAL